MDNKLLLLAIGAGVAAYFAKDKIVGLFSSEVKSSTVSYSPDISYVKSINKVYDRDQLIKRIYA